MLNIFSYLGSSLSVATRSGAMVSFLVLSYSTRHSEESYLAILAQTFRKSPMYD